MPSLVDAALTPAERSTLERFARLLERELGPDLHGVWLYGSRARGEQPRDDSDVDVLVVANREGDEYGRRVYQLLDEAADAEGARSARFSVQLYEPERLAQRREIRSFFIQEVDRDKIVVAGKP